MINIKIQEIIVKIFNLYLIFINKNNCELNLKLKYSNKLLTQLNNHNFEN